ncbi:unnamed protein product, partial [Mesorhabditis spiculigera]
MSLPRYPKLITFVGLPDYGEGVGSNDHDGRGSRRSRSAPAISIKSASHPFNDGGFKEVSQDLNNNDFEDFYDKLKKNDVEKAQSSISDTSIKGGEEIVIKQDYDIEEARLDDTLQMSLFDASIDREGASNIGKDTSEDSGSALSTENKEDVIKQNYNTINHDNKSAGGGPAEIPMQAEKFQMAVVSPNVDNVDVIDLSHEAEVQIELNARTGHKMLTRAARRKQTSAERNSFASLPRRRRQAKQAAGNKSASTARPRSLSLDDLPAATFDPECKGRLQLDNLIPPEPVVPIVGQPRTPPVDNLIERLSQISLQVGHSPRQPAMFKLNTLLADLEDIEREEKLKEEKKAPSQH